MLTLHLQDINVQHFAVTREFNVCPGLSYALPVLMTPTHWGNTANATTQSGGRGTESPLTEGQI